jgi:hypothetical protein
MLSMFHVESVVLFITYYYTKRRSWWQRGLRRESSAARLLGLRVRIPLRHGNLSLVNVVCCQVEASATGWSLVQRSPTECVCVSFSVISCKNNPLHLQ